MIQPIPHSEPQRLEMPDTEFERICQGAAREAVVRNAKLGFPSVSSENGQIVFRSPECVLAEFAVAPSTNANSEAKPSTSSL